MPEIIKTIGEMRALAGAWKKEGLSLGLVPTMGFLHAGHQSLIDRARAENDRVAVSIFINPAQFGPGEDLAGYPRDLERDREVCREIEAIFLPAAPDMYPPETRTWVTMPELTETLCGASRPGHFQGVLTVVTKLFNIVMPDRAYFGRKDAQQLAVIERLVRDLNMPVTVVPCPLVREPDGLALSSRNVYLSPEERRAALVLSRGLAAGRRRLAAGETRAGTLKAEMRALIEEEPLVRLDYLEIVDAATMQPAAVIDRPVLAALAAFVGRARLIDNFSWPGQENAGLFENKGFPEEGHVAGQNFVEREMLVLGALGFHAEGGHGGAQPAGADQGLASGQGRHQAGPVGVAGPGGVGHPANRHRGDMLGTAAGNQKLAALGPVRDDDRLNTLKKPLQIQTGYLFKKLEFIGVGNKDEGPLHQGQEFVRPEGVNLLAGVADKREVQAVVGLGQAEHLGRAAGRDDGQMPVQRLVQGGRVEAGWGKHGSGVEEGELAALPVRGHGAAGGQLAGLNF